MRLLLPRGLDERGHSISVFAVMLMATLIMVTGLVVDGGQKLTASTRAESAAAGAARAAGNAAATKELAGESAPGAAVLAAKAFLAGTQEVEGSVSVEAGVVTVRTHTTQPTVILSMIGIDSFSGSGFAEANIVPTGETR